MADSWIAWTILFVLVAAGLFKLAQAALDDWESKDNQEYHFTGYEDRRWR